MIIISHRPFDFVVTMLLCVLAQAYEITGRVILLLHRIRQAISLYKFPENSGIITFSISHSEIRSRIVLIIHPIYSAMQRSITIGLIILACVAFTPSSLIMQAYADEDEFGIEKLYPTGDETWEMEDDDPKKAKDGDDDDHPFRFGTDKNIEDLDYKGNGIWKMDVTTGSHEHGARMHVYRPDGEDWKNVEMTGYFKVLEGDDQITMIARHGRSYHANDGCEALGYYAMVDMDGNAYFKKKLHHEDGGYSDRVAEVEDAIDDLKGEWVGLKFVVYNTGDDEVKLELYGDAGDETNDWKLLTEYTDDGDLEVHERDCARPTNYVIDEGQPRATYRIDDSEFEFKNLSVREIEDED